MSKLLIIGLCFNADHLTQFVQMVKTVDCNAVVLDTTNTLSFAECKIPNISLPIVGLPYARQAPTQDEVLWQLPLIVDANYPNTTTVIFVNVGSTIINCNAELEYITSALSHQPVIFGQPNYADKGLSEIGMTPFNCDVCIFNAHSPSARSFFEGIRDIGRNWAQICLNYPEKLRIKRLDVECNIALQLSEQLNTTPFVISGWYDSNVTKPLGNVLVTSGVIIPPFEITLNT